MLSKIVREFRKGLLDGNREGNNEKRQTLKKAAMRKMRFYFLHFLPGKNAQNRPENQQN